MKELKRKIWIYGIGAFVFSFLYYLAYNSNFYVIDGSFFTRIGNATIWLLLGTVIGIGLLILIEKIVEFFKRKYDNDVIKNEIIVRKSFRKVTLQYSTFFFISFIPAFLSYYPGIFAYDAQYQYGMIANGRVSSWHTLAHTFLFYVAFHLEKVWNVNLAWGLFTMLQMLALAVSFGFGFAFLEEVHTNKFIRNTLCIAMLLFPVNHIYAISWTKDILFAAFFLLFTIQSLRIYREEKIENVQWVVWTVFVVGMLLFRNNALYAYIVGLPFFIYLFRRKQCKNLLISGVAALLAYKLIIIGLANIMHAEVWTSRTEVCSILIQQVACVYCNTTDGKELLKDIYSFIPENALSAYDPYIADPVKGLIDNNAFAANFGVFVKTWLNGAIHHFDIYVKAFIANNLGIWYLPDKIHSYIYGRTYVLGGAEAYMDGIYLMTFVPFFKKIYESIFASNGFQKVPVIRLFFTPACYTVLLYIFGILSIAQKRKNVWIAYIMVILYFCTVLLAPVALARYVYCLIVVTPFLLVYACSEDSKKSK